MGDDARERLRRRLQRYRQHHEASSCRYDNHINSVSEQQREQTRLLHKRWLESRCSVSAKRLKLTVLDEGTIASSNSSVNLHTSESLVRTVAILQKWVPYSQRYLVLGLVALGLPLLLRLGLVGLALWLVSGIALNKYRCE